MLNFRLGICTFSAAGHQIQTWTQIANKKRVTVPDKELLEGYKVVGHYVPGKPETDGGCMMPDVLKYWRDTGIGGHKVEAWVNLEAPGDPDRAKTALWLFGGLYAGVNLPLSASDQWMTGLPWTFLKKTGRGLPGSWFPHAVNIVAAGPNWITCVTWGGLQTMSWNFWKNYCDECYPVLSNDWMTAAGPSPPGFDRDALVADMKELG